MNIKARLFTCSLLVAAIAAVLANRLVHVQLMDDQLRQPQDGRPVMHEEHISAHRGFIFDRNGEILAGSKPAPSIWAIPAAVDIQSDGFHQLAILLGLDLATLYAHFDRYKNYEFIYLKRKATVELRDRIEALGLDGVHAHTEYKRYYPASEIAAHVVGFVDVDGLGQEGIELAFDDSLKGAPGLKKVLRDESGRQVADLGNVHEPRVGEDLVLSLDSRLQHLAHHELSRAILKHQAKSGSIILLDSYTGEILALANQPSYNPNIVSVQDDERTRNRALTDAFEPGSIIGPLFVAGALDNQQYQPDALIDTNPGFVQIANTTITDPVNYGVIDLETLLVRSSQVGIAKLAQNMFATDVFHTLTDFGFGKSTGVELPSEEIGKLPSPTEMSELSKTAITCGYGVTVTAMQIAQAYLTFVNEGFSSQLTMLKQPDSPRQRRLIQHVIEDITAAQILAMLEGVVERADGTANGINNSLYRMAGKTGTVHKVVNSKPGDRGHTALFVGIAPVSDPRLVGVVVINEPQGRLRHDGGSAAHVFANVATTALRLMNVLPDHNIQAGL